MIRINGIKCLLCGDTLYSRTGHDFRFCSCGNIFVDGGPSLVGEKRSNESTPRYGWHIESKTKQVVVDLDISSVDLRHVSVILHEDWNYDKNKYGLIKDASYTEEDRVAAEAKIKLFRAN